MAEPRGPIALLRLRALQQRASESLFLLPALMVLAGAAVGFAVDLTASGFSASDVPSFLVIHSGAAETLLSSVASATITTVGVVFSIVVLSVQLASNQFSPRIVQNFLTDRRSQLTVGILGSTFTYCVVALYDVSGIGGGSGNVPIVAVGVAVLLGVASILSIVSFLNHSARRLYVGDLALRVAQDSVRVLERMSPDQGATRAEGEDGLDDEGPDDALTVPAPDDGWVQQVSGDALLDAIPDGATLRLQTRVGAYVAAGVPLATVWPRPADADAVTARVQDGLVVGSGRTMQQDVDYGIRQLADIALRALSPSVNDPHTGVEAVLRLASVLHRLMACDLPPRVRSRDGRRLLRPHDLDHTDYVQHAFGEIRRAAADHPAVLETMIRACGSLADAARAGAHPERAAAPLEQARLALAGAERAGLLEEDLAGIRKLAEQVQRRNRR